ncbi:cytochrome P450 [Cucurbitaria berberidis CBS 394.84]|uniref:Cytochrome P450 n=1 Tax=Cucurbitaria berberidis CBS 394.84 TaxID=1168544 RepID=A0A9P4LEN8_9PLEO|nr:cytochrome P450 [Cucurbitaria berberidis CBS 394.84]KAF1852230.1 cytochrome P450 [Cucurbitaria berberidis CBS 394.84]
MQYGLYSSVRQFLQARYDAWAFLFNGPDMIQDAFEKSNGRPFEMFAPDNRYVFVSSADHIKELDCAPDTVLSLQAASKQMLQPKYSMHGFNWFDRRGTEGKGFIRALRTLLTNHLPTILPDLRIATSDRMKLRQIHCTVGDIYLFFTPGTSRVSIYPMIVTLVVLANSLSFFGEELAKNETFMKAALSYVEETLLIAEIVRLLPRFLAPIIGPLLGKMVSSQAIVYKALMVVAEERVQARDLGIKTKTCNDCIQWIMDTSPKQNPWSAQRVVFELMAIWFGSVHAMSTTAVFAVQDLCIHPEYISPIRKELESSEYAEFEQTARGLPLLDSFIKESARLTPVESISTRRQALKPFSLSNGTQLAVGDWACTPVKALMRAHYPQPLDFNGFRFVDPKMFNNQDMSINEAFQLHASKLTDVGNTYHVWGTGRMTCPGRFYAAVVMKLLVAQVVLNYDFELMDKGTRRCWTWRSSMLPMESTLVKFWARKRQ